MSLIVDVMLSELERQPLSAMRERYFPSTRLKIAHITIFHNLPDIREGAIRANLQSVVSGYHRPFTLKIRKLQSLGRGWALTLESPELIQIQTSLRRCFKPWLQAQDLQPYRPHITLANKLSKTELQATRIALEQEAMPTTLEARGLGLHLYNAGHWELLDNFIFGT